MTGKRRGYEERDGAERDRLRVGGRLHLKVSLETNIFFLIIDQSVCFGVKFNVWVHLATVDSLDPGQRENRECKSVTQNRPSGNIFQWRHRGRREEESSLPPEREPCRESRTGFSRKPVASRLCPWRLGKTGPSGLTPASLCPGFTSGKSHQLTWLQDTGPPLR